MKRKKKLSAGQKKRRQKKIEKKIEKEHDRKRAILFREFDEQEFIEPEIGDLKGFINYPIRAELEFDEAIIAAWHEHYARMRNLLFLKF